MFRTIATAAIVSAFTAYTLQRTTIAGRLEEPLLLLIHGDAVPDRGEGVLGPAGEEDGAGGRRSSWSGARLSQVDHV